MSPIEVTVAGIVAILRPELANAYAPIDVTESGITTVLTFVVNVSSTASVVSVAAFAGT